MNIEKTKEAIKVMQAYVDGKSIEYTQCGIWHPTEDPIWNWSYISYRVKRGKTVRYAVINSDGNILTIHKYKDIAEQNQLDYEGSELIKLEEV